MAILCRLVLHFEYFVICRRLLFSLTSHAEKFDSGFELHVIYCHKIQAFQIGATLLKLALEVVIFLHFVENQFTCRKFIAGSEEFSGAFSTIIRPDMQLYQIYKLYKN